MLLFSKQQLSQFLPSGFELLVRQADQINDIPFDYVTGDSCLSNDRVYNVSESAASVESAHLSSYEVVCQTGFEALVYSK